MMLKYSECKACGTPFPPKVNGTAAELKYCPTCMKIKNTKIDSINMEIQRRATYKKAQRSMSKIGKCVAAARAMGMSYGEYMAFIAAVKRGDKL